MKEFSKGQRVFVVEPDGVALGHYVGLAKKTNEHKVKMHTESSGFSLIKDPVIFADYKDAKKAILSDEFHKTHFQTDSF